MTSAEACRPLVEEFVAVLEELVTLARALPGHLESQAALEAGLAALDAERPGVKHAGRSAREDFASRERAVMQLLSEYIATRGEFGRRTHYLAGLLSELGGRLRALADVFREPGKPP